MKPTSSVGAPTKKSVNRDENRDRQLGIEIIDESEFRKRRRCSVSEIGSTGQQLEIEIIDESEFRKWRRCSVSEIGSTGQQLEIEIIDESEFRKRRRCFVSDHLAGTSAKDVKRSEQKCKSEPSSIKNDRNKQRGKASGSALKRKGPALNKNVVDDDEEEEEDSSSDKSPYSSSRTESDSDAATTSPQDSEVSCVANRTRLKTGSIKKSSEVGSVSLGPSADSDSLPTVSESDNSLDSDFEVNSSDNDIELLDTQQQACEVKPADMANQRKVPTKAKEAAPSSHSNDSHQHSPNCTKGIIEAATTSDSQLRGKSKPANMASQNKVPTVPKKVAPPSHSKIVTADNAGCSSNATGTVWSIKPGVRESMYEHQREGFEFLWKNLAGSINLDELKSTDPVGVGGCIISHAPGTGKTHLTMVFIQTYFKMFPDCRPVIICPSSTLLTWEEEFKKWNVEFPFHNLKNLEWSGNELFQLSKIKDKEIMRMVKIRSWAEGGSVLGISYRLFEKLTGQRHIIEMTKKKKTEAAATTDKMVRQILLKSPGLVVLDEGHTLRNEKSNIWNALLKLQTEKRIILSGTPFLNNYDELFNTLRIVRPAIADELAQEKTFAEAVMPWRGSSSNKHKREHGESSLVSEDGLESLKARMSPFIHLHKVTLCK